MNLYLRELTKDDYELTMTWRSDPDIYQGFYTQTSPLTWEEHINWIQLRNQDWRTFIVVLKEGETERRIGVFTIGQLDHWCPEIGYYIGEKSLWGKGYGKQAVKLGLDYIKNYGREYAHTTVLDSNIRSVNLLLGLGFQKLGPARPGESWYQRKF